MSTTTRNWRPYLDYLESRLDVLVSSGAIASRWPESNWYHQNKKIKQIVNYDVEFADMLEVHNLRHKLCLARTAISKNCLVLNALNALKADAAPGQSSNDGSSATSVSHMAGQFKLELDSMLTRADNLMIRLDGASTLVGSDGTAFEISC